MTTEAADGPTVLDPREVLAECDRLDSKLVALAIANVDRTHLRQRNAELQAALTALATDEGDETPPEAPKDQPRLAAAPEPPEAADAPEEAPGAS